MNIRRSVIFVFMLVMLFSSFSLVSAYELDLRVTATANGLSGSFNAITYPTAERGFDGYDSANTPLPSNYLYVYSNISDPALTGGQLALDAWNQSTNPRVLTLTVQVNPSVSAVPLVLDWTGSSFNGFDVVLKDYGNTNRVSVVSTKVMTTSPYTYNISSFTGTNRYFTIEVTNATFVPDTTAPGVVTGLNYISKGNNYINWGWTNPTDSDFSEAIIYIDGVNIVNNSLGRYNATGLLANTTHTIKINTKDSYGNVNLVNVNDTQVTNLFGLDIILNPLVNDSLEVNDSLTIDPRTGLPITNTNIRTGNNGLPINGGGDAGNGTGNQSSSSNIFNLGGKVGLVYGLIGVGIVIVIVIAVILIRIIRRSAKHQHHIEKHLKHIHRERIRLMRRKRL